MAGPQVTLTFVGDTRDVERAFGRVGASARNMSGDVDSASDRMTRGADAFGQVNQAATIASAAVVGGFAVWAHGAIGAAEESEAAGRALENVFNQMGGAGSAAFRQAGQAAEDIGRALAVDDDAITAIQTKLGTFGAIWQDPVHGAENFNRATTLAFDLAAAGFGEADSNATQLGRALQDPTRGMTALARSGVTFTEAEKEKIKQLQQSGDLLGAQEMIYQALERQVGGTAEASVTGSQRMATSMAELSESFGRLLLPAVDKVSEAVQGFTSFAERNKTVVATVAGVLVGLATAILVVNAAIKVWRATVMVATAAQWLWNIAMTANPIGLIILAIVALIAIIVLVVKNWDTVKAAFFTAWEFIWGYLKKFIAWIVSVFWENGIKKYFQLWANIISWVRDRFQAGFDRIKGFVTSLIDRIRALPGRIRSGFSSLFSILTAPFRSAFNFIADAWNNTIGSLSWSVPSWVPGIGGNSVSVPNLPHFHQGGVVPGAPGQEVLAVLQAGEKVTPAGAQDSITIAVERGGGSSTDQALASLVLHLIRTGALQMRVQQGRVTA